MASSKPAIAILRVLFLLGLLYFFLSSISLLGVSFKLLGQGAADQLIHTTSNPFVGLLIGILVTSIVQSSSLTTSTVVGLVSGGALTISNAIPIVMGANIGTTVTNTIVSVGHITRDDEFRRAYAGAIIDDIFNVLAVAILLPLEMATHWMERSADALAGLFYGSPAVAFHSPVKLLVKPFADSVNSILIDLLHLPEKAAGVFGIFISLILLFVALTYIVKFMRKFFATRVETAVSKIFGASGYLTILIGLSITAIIQSSSITTSMLVPLLGAGVITLENAYPLALGANIGTTVTAIMAALAGNQAGLAIAFVHLLFNLSGVAIFFPLRPMRKIPIFLARTLATFTTRNKIYAFIYILVLFFVIPVVGILLTRQP